MLNNDLIKASANMFELYRLTHVAHFNVIDIGFAAHHSFLKDLYEQFNGFFDEISECIRINGNLVPTDFDKEHVIPLVDVTYDPESIFDHVHQHLAIVIAAVEAAWKSASEEKKLGIQFKLESIIQELYKTKWMIESSK